MRSIYTYLHRFKVDYIHFHYTVNKTFTFSERYVIRFLTMHVKWEKCFDNNELLQNIGFPSNISGQNVNNTIKSSFV